VSSDTKINYLKYVKDVLGIKHLFFSSSQQETKVLAICVDGLRSYSPQESELLYKMIAALKLPPEVFEVVDSIEYKNGDAEFEWHLRDVGQPEKSEKMVSTYSPRMLLLQPQLKKDAWADMQELLQKIQPRL